MELLTWTSLVGIFALLAVLAIIDAKTGYLPDIFTGPLALVSMLYHWSLVGAGYNLVEALLCASAVTLFLLGFRAIGNRIYQRESLGLGDVKLLGAAALLLSFPSIVYAMTAGLLITAIAGLILAKKRQAPLRNFSLPWGPGLCAGIAVVFAGGLSGVFM